VCRGFIRKVKTASGATAVQIVGKRSGVRRIVEHVGSAHDEAELAVLVQVARERLHATQRVPAEAYARLGFDVLGDEAFAAMVLARCCARSG
jgi:hypothetical protein